MARPKKYADSGSFGVRFPTEILDSLNKYAKSRDKTRSEVVVNAVDNYIHGKQCIRCGAMNPAEGKHCAVCGADLFTYEEVKNGLIELCKMGLTIPCSRKSVNFDKIDELKRAGFEEDYRFEFLDEQQNSREKSIILLTLCMRLKGSDFVISDSNDSSSSFLVYAVVVDLLMAYLKNDIEGVKKLREGIISVLMEDPNNDNAPVRMCPICGHINSVNELQCSKCHRILYPKIVELDNRLAVVTDENNKKTLH